MKKVVIIISIAVVILLAMFFIFKFVKFETKYYKKLNLRDDDQKMMALIYIGGKEEFYDNTIVQKYFKDTSFETVTVGGTERYLIIPRYTNYTVEVYKLALTPGGQVKAEKLCDKSTPFYIDCNESDIFSNVMLKIKTEKNEYNYTPFISLKDGSIIVEDFVTNVEE